MYSLSIHAGCSFLTNQRQIWVRQGIRTAGCLASKYMDSSPNRREGFPQVSVSLIFLLGLLLFPLLLLRIGPFFLWANPCHFLINLCIPILCTSVLSRRVPCIDFSYKTIRKIPLWEAQWPPCAGPHERRSRRGHEGPPGPVYCLWC